MKILYLILLFWSINLALFMFAGESYEDGSELSEMANAESIRDINFFDVLRNNILTGVVGGGLIIAGLFTSNNLFIYAGLGASILSWGQLLFEVRKIFIGTWNVLGGNFNEIIFFLFGIIIIAWIWAIMEFIRGRDT